MNLPRSRIAWLLAAAMAAALAGPAMAADEFMLAGSGDRLWLVRTGEDATSFDVLTYRAGEKWRWVQRGIAGRPTAAVVAGEQLHVLTGPPPAYLVVYADESRRPAIGETPPSAIWPGEAAPLAACGAEDLAGVPGWSLVVVAGGAASADGEPEAAPPADQPVVGDVGPPEDAPQPVISSQPADEAPAAPAVLQFGDGNWRRLTDLPAEAMTDGDSVHVGAAGKALFLLVTDASGQNNLWRWPSDEDGPWTQLSLAGHAASSAVVALLRTGPDELTLVLASPAAQDQGERLELVSLDSSGVAKAPQPITTLNGEPLALSARPLAAPLDVLRRVALLWREDGATRFTLCDLVNGAAEPPGEVTALTEAPMDRTGPEVLNYFLIVLVVATLAVMIGARPRTTPGPLILPPTCRPAPLAKRALAGLIDLAPISIIVSVFAPMPEPPAELMGDFSALWEWGKQALATRQAVFSVVAMLCTYMVYGVVMEARFAATLGKMMLKLRVVAGDGRPPGLREAVLRNLVKTLEINMPWLLLIVPLLNPARQRLGDILARTVVIEYQQLTGVPGAAPPPPTDDESFIGPEDDKPDDS